MTYDFLAQLISCTICVWNSLLACSCDFWGCPCANDAIPAMLSELNHKLRCANDAATAYKSQGNCRSWHISDICRLWSSFPRQKESKTLGFYPLDHGIGETRRCNSIYFVEDCARASANICRLRNQPGHARTTGYTLSPMIKDDKDGCDPENLPTWPLPCTGTAGLPRLAALLRVLVQAFRNQK